MTKPAKIDRDFVRHVGGAVLAAKLAGMPDVSDDYLVKASDVAVRAAVALEAALDRASDAAEAGEAAERDAEQAAKVAEQEAKAAEAKAAKPSEPVKKV